MAYAWKRPPEEIEALGEEEFLEREAFVKLANTPPEKRK